MADMEVNTRLCIGSISTATTFLPPSENTPIAFKMDFMPGHFPPRPTEVLPRRARRFHFLFCFLHRTIFLARPVCWISSIRFTYLREALCLNENSCKREIGTRSLQHEIKEEERFEENRRKKEETICPFCIAATLLQTEWQSGEKKVFAHAFPLDSVPCCININFQTILSLESVIFIFYRFERLSRKNISSFEMHGIFIAYFTRRSCAVVV